MHSDAYSCIGYISGYLRYYYPYEFLTAALNIFNDNQDKTAEITKYAGKIGIQVTPPKWGVSRSEYFYDKERHVIAKDLTSVKYMNGSIADEMYMLAKENTYTRFIDVLIDLVQKTRINTRQIDILIKIDFFSEFGNQRELLHITEMFFNKFNEGNAKQIKKAEVEGSQIESIIQKYSIGVTKSGAQAKSYTIVDILSLMHEVEDAIKGLHVDDLSDIIKIKNFVDIMGYVGYVSGKDADRRKLYVLDVFPLVRKDTGKQFGSSVITKSIGSGKESRFTVVDRVFKTDPIKKGDIIYCNEFERNGEYFRLNRYTKIY